MTPLCPTCHGDCCTDKRGRFVVAHGAELARHFCPDCPDGFAPPAPAPDLAAARLAALLVAECENTALRAEVAHLRKERAAVVDGLRAWAGQWEPEGAGFAALSHASKMIERGDHRREGKP